MRVSKKLRYISLMLFMVFGMSSLSMISSVRAADIQYYTGWGVWGIHYKGSLYYAYGGLYTTVKSEERTMGLYRIVWYTSGQSNYGNTPMDIDWITVNLPGLGIIEAGSAWTYKVCWTENDYIIFKFTVLVWASGQPYVHLDVVENTSNNWEYTSHSVDFSTYQMWASLVFDPGYW